MALTPTQQARVDKYIEATPVLSKGIVSRALAGSSSPRQAIKAKCLTCTNFDREEIAECRVVICPLHPYRPFQTQAEAEDEHDEGG
jgi:hypothetical protein